MKKSLLLLIFLGLFSVSRAQDIPLGTWRSHLNYSDSRLLALYHGNIYVAAANGLFYYNTSDNSINKLTKNDGLSDVGITAMAVTPNDKKLIIGYSSGQVDILEGNTLVAIDEIKNIAGPEDKGINEIIFYNNLAYLCTGFGLATLDYQQGIVKETSQNIGENGTQLAAGSGTVFRDSLFLATPEGIISTSISVSNNLMDYNNWVRLKNQIDSLNAEVGLISSFNDKMYVDFLDSGLYNYDGNRWERINFPQDSNIKNLIPLSTDLYVITGNENRGHIYKLNKQNEAVQLTANTVSNPSDLLILNDGTVWVADQKLGLVADVLGPGANIYPDGPASDNISKLIYFENAIAGIEEGIDERFNKKNLPGQLFIYKAGEWQNFSSANASFLTGINDFTDLAYHPGTSNILISTFGNGTVGFNINSHEFTRPFDPENSLFTSSNISALAVSNDGSVWISEYNISDKLWGRIEDQWINFPLSAISHVKEIKTIPYQYVWLRLDKGMIVLDPESGNMQQLNLGNGSLIHDTITAYAADEYDYMWYGTPSGIAYVNDEGQLFEGGASSVVPEYQNGNLFDFQRIEALEIDAANRKWIATAEGLWLFSENGDSLISHFTEENSPLVSNAIQDIAINAASGEVFIATEKGLVSYRSNASAGQATHQQVKIFPNPVKPDFNGIIGISGVVEGAIVKITDLSGNLVKEIHAQGGTATWDGNTLSGRRVSSGIYLVFSASQDGKETLIGKLAFLN